MAKKRRKNFLKFEANDRRQGEVFCVGRRSGDGSLSHR